MPDANYGWINNPREVERIVNSLPHPIFSSAAPHLKDTGKGQDVFLWLAEKQLTGKVRPPHKQTIGDCVSHGFGGAIDDLRFVRIAWQGDSAEGFIESSTEAIYGGSRIEIGRGQVGAGDGSIGAWAADWLLKYGIIHRLKYDNVDLTVYSGRLAKSWGMSGIPKDLEKSAKEFPAKTVSMVNSWEDVRDAIAGAKCPVAICSNQGFTTTRTKDGFCTPKGSWGHCHRETAIISGVETKQIIDVNIDDLIYGHDGKLHRVTDTMCRDYNGDMITIKATGNIPFSLTTEHPLYVLRNGEFKWINAINLRLSDSLLSPKFTHDTIRIQTWIGTRGQNIPNEVEAPSKDLAFMFGYYIANGNIKKGHGVEFTLPLHYEWLAVKIQNIFRNTLNIFPRVEEKKNCWKVKADSVIIENTFREWFGDYSHTKKIPYFLFTWPQECLESLIEGMYLGDGNTYNNQISYNTTSPILMRQLWHLQIMFGKYINASYDDKARSGRYDNALPQYHLTYTQDVESPQTQYIKSNINNVEYYVMPIKSISRYPYSGKVYNLSVADVESYIADGNATHNCTYFRGISDNPKRPGGVYQQSWGEGMPDGPLHVILPHGLELDLPEGAFFVDAQVIDKMVKQNDSFIIADIVGYPARPDSDFEFKLY